MHDQITIIRGEDRNMILRMIFKDSTEPYDLINWTKISVEFKKADRTILEKTTDPYGGEFASGLYDNVTYTANSIGAIGNTIELTFDGNNTIQQVIDAWNSANPTNTVSSDAADDQVVPPAGSVQLNGGVEPQRDVEVINETLGKISVRLSDDETAGLKRGPNQSFKVVVDKGEHPNGDRRIVLFDSKLNIVDADL